MDYLWIDVANGGYSNISTVDVTTTAENGSTYACTCHCADDLRNDVDKTLSVTLDNIEAKGHCRVDVYS